MSALYLPDVMGPRLGSGCSVMVPGVTPVVGDSCIQAAVVLAFQFTACWLFNAKVSVWAWATEPLTIVKLGTPPFSTNCRSSSCSVKSTPALWPSCVVAVTRAL
jgi:hypothetical protein